MVRQRDSADYVLQWHPSAGLMQGGKADPVILKRRKGTGEISFSLLS